MQSYKRKITYFYQFHNGNVGSTAGFLKLEIRKDKVKIIINIQEPPGLPYKGASLYFYHEAGDHLSAVKVDEMESIGDVLTYQNRTDWQQLFDTGRDLYTFDGVAVVYDDNHYYIGDFQDKNRKDYDLVRKDAKKDKKKENVEVAEEVFPKAELDAAQKRTVGYRPMKQKKQQVETGEIKKDSMAETSEEQPQLEEISGLFEQQSGQKEDDKKEDASAKELKDLADEQAEDGQGIYEKCDDCPYQKKRAEQQEQEDAFEKLLTECPKLPMYGATELFDCVRIHPKDIGKLDIRNWKLGVNSFLTHGFYTYQYLLLGKMHFDDGTERGIIGVPGVFSNREKYLANMFGFEQFIPIKKTGTKTGEFGYWISEIKL